MPTFVIAGLFAALVAMPAMPAATTQAAKLLRVFVQTDDSGDGEELAARQQSVRDLSQALASKKKIFVIADSEDSADVEIEVVGRGVTIPKVVIGIGPRPGPSSIATGPVKAAELRIRVSLKSPAVGYDSAGNLKNKNKAADNPRGWKSAADDLADQIEKWIFERRGKG